MGNTRNGNENKEDKGERIFVVVLYGLAVLIIVMFPLIFKVFNASLDDVVKSSAEERLDYIGLEYVDSTDELSFEHTFSPNESEVTGGVMYEFDLVTFEDVNLKPSGSFSSTRVYEVGFINKDNEEQRIQDSFKVHYYQNKGETPRFIVDGLGYGHVWLEPGTIDKYEHEDSE